MIGIRRLYQLLQATYDVHAWWPADSAFEIMIGALLVQRTTWTNVERALTQLKQQGLLEPRALASIPIAEVERCIRCAGFYRSKAARLQSLAAYVDAAGGPEKLADIPTAELHKELLTLPGIGRETAAAILLYAYERPVVVIDAYLRRLLQRINAGTTPPPDALIDAMIAAEIPDHQSLNELHALVVEHARRTCLKTPRCIDCTIRAECRTGIAASETQLR